MFVPLCISQTVSFECTDDVFCTVSGSDRTLGIIVGVCIGGGCIIICAIIILLRNR